MSDKRDKSPEVSGPNGSSGGEAATKLAVGSNYAAFKIGYTLGTWLRPHQMTPKAMEYAANGFAESVVAAIDTHKLVWKGPKDKGTGETTWESFICRLVDLSASALSDRASRDSRRIDAGELYEKFKDVADREGCPPKKIVSDEGGGPGRAMANWCSFLDKPPRDP